MKHKTFYDTIARSYASENRIAHPQRGELLYTSWINECNKIDWSTALDLGCGSGQSTRLLAHHSKRVVGVDSSDVMLFLAKEEESRKPQNISYIFQDVHEPFNLREQFDIVTPSLLLHYSRTIQELDMTVQNIARHLKCGGRMIAMNTRLDRPTQSYKPGLSHSARWIGKPYCNGSCIEVTIYGLDKNRLATFNNYYWNEFMYRSVFKKYGLGDITWIPIQASDNFRMIYREWQDFENTMIVSLISAVKI